jgi:DNA-binding NarL/FixJ family response regulator
MREEVAVDGAGLDDAGPADERGNAIAAFPVRRLFAPIGSAAAIGPSHQFLRAFQRLLEPACEVVGCVADGIALLEETARIKPDIVVLDLAMPGRGGLDACQEIKKLSIQTKVIFVTATNDDQIMERSFRAGASAFVLKHRAADDLLPAIEKALRGTRDF